MSDDTYDTEPLNPNWHPSIQALVNYQAANYTNVAAIALIGYDSLLTAPQAWKYIFQRKFNIITLLYILAQYGTLCELILTFILEVDETVATSTKCIIRQICNPINLTYYLVFAAAGVGIQGLLLGRAYAAAYRNRKIMAALGMIFLINVGLATSLVGWWRCDAFQGAGFTTLGMTIHISCEISIVVFDIGVLATILYHTWDLRKASLASPNGGISIGVLFVRQGVFRFVIISAWSFADALSLKLARPSAAGIDFFLEFAISPILLGRFLFQLRETAEPKDQISTSTENALTIIWRTKGIIGAFRNIEQTILSELGDNEIPFTTRTDIEMTPRNLPPTNPHISIEDELE
ncbi:hypothetical protein M422DRAFT_246186 [Sphaerobolus stellatus SS14]|nr:hypothetical protein M422DRAFT_246186 [Sphaerobolus stellatus SS14]